MKLRKKHFYLGGSCSLSLMLMLLYTNAIDVSMLGYNYSIPLATTSAGVYQPKNATMMNLDGMTLAHLYGLPNCSNRAYWNNVDTSIHEKTVKVFISNGTIYDVVNNKLLPVNGTTIPIGSTTLIPLNLNANTITNFANFAAAYTKSPATYALKSFPQWDQTLYNEFALNGVRINGEHMMSARYSLIWSSVLAACGKLAGDSTASTLVTDSEADRYLKFATKTMSEVAGQPEWELPAHKSSVKVDLISSKISKDLAFGHYLLQNYLPIGLKIKIKEQVQLRVFNALVILQNGDVDPFTSTNNFWINNANNWNAVCLEGVVSASILLNPKSVTDSYIRLAFLKIDNYLKAFTPSGYSLEGASYWDYGYSSFMELRDMILRYSGSIIDLAIEPTSNRVNNVINSMLFLTRYEMAPKAYAPFGDSNLSMSGLGEDQANYIAESLNISTFKTKFQRATSLLDPIYQLKTKPVVIPPATVASTSFALNLSHLRLNPVGQVLPTQQEIFQSLDFGFNFKDAGVFVSRFPVVPGSLTAPLSMTIKSGYPAVGNSHWHYDAGSYSVTYGNLIIAGDQGKFKSYSASSFNQDRPKSNLINSFGHPVPLIGSGKIISKDASNNWITPDTSAAVNSMQTDAVSKVFVPLDITPSSSIVLDHALTLSFLPYYKNIFSLSLFYRWVRHIQNGSLIFKDQFYGTQAINFETAITTDCIDSTETVAANVIPKCRYSVDYLNKTVKISQMSGYTSQCVILSMSSGDLDQFGQPTPHLNKNQFEIYKSKMIENPALNESFVSQYTRIGIRFINPRSNGFLRLEYAPKYDVTCNTP